MIQGETPGTIELLSGEYTVTATFESQTKTQKVVILDYMVTVAGFDFTTNTPPKPKSFGARTIGPFGIPSVLLHQLWKLREKTVRKEVHKKLHPLV